MYYEIPLTEYKPEETLEKKLYSILSNCSLDKHGKYKNVGECYDRYISSVYAQLLKKEDIGKMNIKIKDKDFIGPIDKIIKESLLLKTKNFTSDEFIFICCQYDIRDWQGEGVIFFDTFIISNGKLYFCDMFEDNWIHGEVYRLVYIIKDNECHIDRKFAGLVNSHAPKYISNQVLDTNNIFYENEMIKCNIFNYIDHFNSTTGPDYKIKYFVKSILQYENNKPSNHFDKLYISYRRLPSLWF